MENYFNNALAEYYNEDPNSGNRNKIIYCYFGLAMYVAQEFEKSFSFMLCLNKVIFKEPKTEVKHIGIIDKIENSKKTLGSFIKEVKDCYDLDEEIKNELVLLLDRRNYLAHKYFINNPELFFSEIGHKEMLKFFCDFIYDIEVMELKLDKYTTKYKQMLDLSDEKVNEIMNEIILKESIREN